MILFGINQDKIFNSSIIVLLFWVIIWPFPVFFFHCFPSFTVSVSLSGKRIGNETEKFIGFIITVYNEYLKMKKVDILWHHCLRE